ncbi:MarR family transcriptional regulator [Bacillus sp. Xin]|uniref:MarR family transcriptional regulator n=1 Tax=unclassified Bacillus (in: firmicutes) TaxID=185979 RepID=UPI001572EF57|nr:MULTISPECIES: MarR family transcriptional regulator [unclassified Bacillus (in: firmicutes)]MBC6973926.1 MarR family transcriptional regulator [Bacillus sp. Xin]NSW39303.1 MarR family transcriptional regulator [Bacillus sp. Xin1]
MTNTINLKQAEKNARLRDIESSKILSEEEMQLANELQSKANARGMKLVPERKVKNKAKFAQFIQQNWKYINEIKYITTAEKAFLVDIIPYIGFGSNCIVENTEVKQQIPLTQEGLGKLIGKNKSQMSKIIKPLIDKGILDRTEGSIEENNVRTYAIFVNPNIIYSGDRDNVNPTLQAMFRRVPKELKKLPIQLF